MFTETKSNSVVFYDGVCGLCNRLTQFLLKHDRYDRLRFAPLQSDYATALLRRHGIDSHDLDTVYVALKPGQHGERVLARSDAILHLARELGGVWRIGELGKLVPRFLRNKIYDVVARNRYRVFGRLDACMLPEAKHRKKFLEL